MRRTSLLAAAALAAAAACDSSAPAPPIPDATMAKATADASTPDLTSPAPGDLAAPPDLSFGPYPAGPYGNKVGSIIPPLVWEGYADPKADVIADTLPYGPYSMDDLRRSGARYALVHVAGFG